MYPHYTYSRWRPSIATICFLLHTVGSRLTPKDFKWVHLDLRCKHTWTAVTSSGGLEYHQRGKQAHKLRCRGDGTESQWLSLAWIILQSDKDVASVASEMHLQRLWTSLLVCVLVRTQRKQQEWDEPRRRAHHSSALIILPVKTTSHISGVVCPRPSCRCLCCVLSPQAELATVFVCDRY